MKKMQINLEGSWIGNIYGTNYSNVLMEFVPSNSGIRLELRVPSNGLNVSIFVGTISNLVIDKAKEISATLSEKINEKDSELQVILTFQAITEDMIQGSWEASGGAKGFIQLSRYKSMIGNKNGPLNEPVEIIAREYKFGNLRIYKKDIQEIIKIMERLITPDGFVFVTYEYEEVRKTNLARVFLETIDVPNELFSLNVSAQRNANGFTHSLVLHLMREGISTLSVQSPDLLWSYSMPMAIKGFLDKRSNKIIEFYRKHGLNFNSLLFLALLVWLPKTIKDRAIFVVFFLTFALLHAYFHKLVSLSLINPKKEHPSGFKEKHSTISYFLLTLLSAFLATGVKVILERWDKIFSVLHIGTV